MNVKLLYTYDRNNMHSILVTPCCLQILAILSKVEYKLHAAINSFINI